METHLTYLSLLLLASSVLSIGATAAPLTEPPTTGILPEIHESDTTDVSHLKQSPELAASIERLQQGTVQERVQALVEKTKRDMIFVEGGVFLMGDFGTEHNEDGLPWSSKLDNKPLHKVQLDSFSLGKYKVTYAEYDVYTDANRLPRVAMATDFDRELRIPPAPAGVKWQGAKDYCRWLGKVTGLPFDLPTEAQWEFAARNRGQFIVYPTDNGLIEEGRNVASYQQLKAFPPTMGATAPYPVGIFPSNPLGFYDLAQNGMEWMNDWYGADFYSKSQLKNPKGPRAGKQKVLRSWPNGDGWDAVSIYRRSRIPEKKPDVIHGKAYAPSYHATVFRCVIQQQVRAR